MRYLVKLNYIGITYYMYIIKIKKKQLISNWFSKTVLIFISWSRKFLNWKIYFIHKLFVITWTDFNMITQQLAHQVTIIYTLFLEIENLDSTANHEITIPATFPIPDVVAELRWKLYCRRHIITQNSICHLIFLITDINFINKWKLPLKINLK